MTRKLAAILFPGQNAPVLRSKSLNLLENNRLISPQKLHALHKQVSSIETESISRTDIVQPILFLQMVNLFERFRSEQGEHVIKYAMGHSLGELAALATSGALSVEGTYDIVIERGNLMHKIFAERSDNYGMLACATRNKSSAISTLEVYDELLKLNNISIASINTSQQFVLSGSVSDLDTVNTKLKQDKSFALLKRIPLPYAFHSTSLSVAAPIFRNFLSTFRFKAPQFDIIMNKTANVCTLHDYAELLSEQLSSTVLWHQSIMNAKSNGVSNWICFGPGNTVYNWIKRELPSDEHHLVDF